MDDVEAPPQVFTCRVAWNKLPTQIISDVTGYQLVNERIYVVTSNRRGFPDKTLVSVFDMYNPNLLLVEFVQE